MNGELGGSARTIRVRSIEALRPRPLGKRVQSCSSAPDRDLACSLSAHSVAGLSAGRSGGRRQWLSGDTCGHLGAS